MAWVDLDYFRRFYQAIDLGAGSEVVLFRQNGGLLARQMHQLRADVPVVLISGYTGPVLTQQALSAGIDRVLTKPLDLRKIAEALSKALARASAH